GSRLPAYMGGVATLYPELPPELLRRSYALGQSDSVLRGTDQVAAEITGQLDRAGVRPGAPDKRWGRSGRSLEEDVRRRLRERPQSFFGDGQQFTYRTVNGRTRVVRVTARPYGRWDRFTFGFANPVKVDTMARTTTTTGRTAVNS
ncbi:hypothetical protein NGM37_46815, partial [Streptomyces sp. TRM76130]|nr:hypothetical protein [Streptomyces sp. TRM76130]